MPHRPFYDTSISGRPWYVVDVRDVAEGEIRLAESTTIPSGTRVMLASGDMIQPELVGPRMTELYPEWAGRVGTGLTSHKAAKKVVRNSPMWMRVFVNNERARTLLGLDFKSWDETLRDTVNSLPPPGTNNSP